MARGAMHRFRGRQGPQRLTQWVGPAAQGYIAVASTGATLVASAAFEESVTLVRTRGFVSILPTIVSADLDIVGAYGMAIVSQEAFAAGIASVPEPFTDSDWGGWVVWGAFAYGFEFADATGVNFPNWSAEIDSKAMRKITPNEVIVTVVESQTGGFSVSFNTRLLIKLS